MGKTNLGRVTFVPRGTYSNKTAYKRLDVVEHEGSSYLFLKDSTGITPTGDSEVAMLLAKKGKDFIYDDFTPEQLAALKGTKGDKGDPGKGLTILGYYGTFDLLKASVTTPEPGDAYGIGIAAPYDIYVFDGVTNDWVDNGKMSGGLGKDEAPLGEMRHSLKVDNPFGSKYIMCAGQPISIDDYPDALKVLPVKGLGVAKKVIYPVLTEAPYVEMENTPFPITGDLIGKMRIIAIPPSTENPTDEDYMAMYASMKMYVDISRDGEIWTQVYEFSKKEGEVFGAANPLMVNEKLIFPLQIIRFDLTNGTQTTEVGRLLITSDFENFQSWEEVEMNVPGVLTTQWEIKSMAYGQGTYVAILKETHEGINRMAMVKSTDLVNWEYVNSEATAWEQSPTGTEWYNLSANYLAGRWLVQFGYFFVGDDIETLIRNENISSGSDAAHMIQDNIEDIYYLSMLGMDVYMLRVSHGIFQLMYDSDKARWFTMKQTPPNGFGASEKPVALVQMGEGTLCWLVLGNNNHYYVWPNGNTANTLSLGEEASGWQLNKAFKLGSKLFMVPNSSSDSPYLGSPIVTAPELSQPGLMITYIKLKE